MLEIVYSINLTDKWLWECATLFTYDIIWLYKKRIEILILHFICIFDNLSYNKII